MKVGDGRGGPAPPTTTGTGGQAGQGQGGRDEIGPSSAGTGTGPPSGTGGRGPPQTSLGPSSAGPNSTVGSGGSSGGHGPGGPSANTNPNPSKATPINTSSSNSSMNEKGSLEPPTPTPKWQLGLMMDKLKAKGKKARKALPVISKDVNVALLERRCILDQNDKWHLQKGLDNLQQSIRINSLHSMVERLEMISRTHGLKFTPGATSQEWFISSDMFYLELLIDPTGLVQDVKIQHDGKAEQQACPEIIEALRKADFNDFTAHLEGLVSIYQLNADKKIKSKAYIALQSLETDLAVMASTTNTNPGTTGSNTVLKSLMGLLLPRRGGHPLKLVFYITPYEFLDTNCGSLLPNDVETIVEKKLGTIAEVSIQGFMSQRLQMNTTVTIVKTGDGKSVPRYGTLNSTNSTALPACFTINLKTPIPIVKDLLQSIQSITRITTCENQPFKPLLKLIANHVGNESLDPVKGLKVILPDQLHCYFMTETPNLEGTLISTISFTLPSEVPKIISILRQQLIFNTLIGSCVRVYESKHDKINDVGWEMFEVTALTHRNIAVVFQHPLEDSLVTMEFDLRDVSCPSCHLHAISNADSIPTLEEHACKVVQMSMSIPMTVRSVILRWQSMVCTPEPPNPDFGVSVGGDEAIGKLETLNPQLPITEMSCGSVSGERGSTTQPNSSTNPGVVMSLLGSHGKNRPPGGGMPSGTSTQQQPSSAIPSLNFHHPLFNFSNLTGLSLQSLQNLSPSSLAQMQMNINMSMLAHQMQGGNQKPSASTSSMLLGLLDQLGQRANPKKRKRKGSSSEPGSSGGGQQPHRSPCPSPSPKSPRGPIPSPSQKSPKRRLSDDLSEIPRSSPSSTAIGLLMSELGIENPDPRWNIDITPVGSSDQGHGQGQSNIRLSPRDQAFQFQDSELDHDYQEKTQSSLQSKFSLPRKTSIAPGPGPASSKKYREFPKRSISLDSSSVGGDGSKMSTDSGSTGPNSSLSITAVSNSGGSLGMGNPSVNSLLAAMRPGIEIIPLPNPVSIPNSITVTPILGRQNSGSGDKKGSSGTLGRKVQDPSSSISDKKFKLEKKDRKRKLEDESDYISKQAKVMSSFFPPGSDKGSLKAMPLSLKGPLPALGLPSKKLVPGSQPLKSSSLVQNKGQGGGKPSVTTLKSVSTTSGLKYPEGSSSPKPLSKSGAPKHERFKAGPASKVGKSSGVSSSGSGSGPVSNLPGLNPIPGLKSLNDPSLTSSSQNFGLLLGNSSGGNSGKFDGGSSAGLNLGSSGLGGSKPGGLQSGTEMGKGQGLPKVPGLGTLGSGNNKKGGGLLAVIDKLKSSANSSSDNKNKLGQGSGTLEESGSGKRDSLNKLDYLKVSSAITSELQKKSLAAGSSPSGGSVGSPSSSGANGSSAQGQGQGNNQEYMVKPGGQGLKLTINKTKGQHQQGSPTGAGKDKIRSLANSIKLMSQGLNKKTGIGGPPGLKPVVPGSGPASKLLGNKKKDGTSSPGLKSSTGGQTKSQPSPGGGGPPNLKPQDEINLTKKLFMPGAVRSLESGGFDAPKFDSNFQIPKKSRSVTPTVLATSTGTGSGSTTSSTGTTEKSVEKESKGSPKETQSQLDKKKDPGQEEGLGGVSKSSREEPELNIAPTLTPNVTEPDSTTTSDGNVVPLVLCPEHEGDPNQSNSSSRGKSNPHSNTGNSGTGPDKELKESGSETKEKVVVQEPPPPDFTSPESPDPYPMDDSVFKNPTMIPTTPVILPLTTIAPPQVPRENPPDDTPASPSPPIDEDEDEDSMVIDVPGDSPTPGSDPVSKDSGFNSGAKPKEVESGSSSMPPPPRPPSSEPSETSGVIGITNSSAQSPKASAPVSLPIVSVHIVHSPSPQPPHSPGGGILLRSPCVVVQSPLSVHASSPYPIDDDLMDEALIGTGS